MANEFLHGLLTQSNELANHRKAENIEAQDLNFVLGKLTFYLCSSRKENNWRMHGYKSEESKPIQKRNLTEVNPMHEQRMNSIKKLSQAPEKKKGPKKN